VSRPTVSQLSTRHEQRSLSAVSQATAPLRVAWTVVSGAGNGQAAAPLRVPWTVLSGAGNGQATAHRVAVDSVIWCW